MTKKNGGQLNILFTTCLSDNYLLNENSISKYLLQKNSTPPPPLPWRLSGAPLMTNHRMSSLAIICAHKDTT